MRLCIVQVRKLSGSENNQASEISSEFPVIRPLSAIIATSLRAS